MKVLSVVGARPQFVKLAPMHRAIVAAGHEHVVVHTGQHYAPELSQSLFTDLDLNAPDVNLEIGSGSHAQQTGRMMMALEPVFETRRPDWILVYGDTNSTLAAALTAVKMHIPVAHLEAGLRSHNREMPEEHNRIVTDHVSDLLLAPTVTAMKHLDREGLAARSRNVGDVMVDVCYQVRDKVASAPPEMPADWIDRPSYALSTIHRAENTDDSERLEYVLDRLDDQGLPVVLVAHPRLVAKSDAFGLDLSRANVHPVGSLTYTQMVYAVTSAAGVITDSGGLQKEAFLLGTPTLTARTETEWPETLVGDWNALDNELRVDAVGHFRKPRTVQADGGGFGDGHASERAVQAMVDFSRT